MKTLAVKTVQDLRQTSLLKSVDAYLNKQFERPYFNSELSLIPGLRICSTFRFLLTAALTLMLSIPSHAERNWEAVDPEKALLKFSNAKRYILQQSKDWQSTLEQSEWMLDDGTVIYFHVTWMGPRWTLVKGGPTIEELFRRIFPQAELVEIGEPFINRDRGTRGQAQWLRYRNAGDHCVLIRQYGWDDDSAVSGRVAMGNRVAIGFRCADVELSHNEIRQIIERIDF